MAETTLNQPGRAVYVSEQVVHEFGPDDGAALLRDVATARAIFRAVLLAVRAQADESIRFENNGVERWHNAVDAACGRLYAVRDLLMNSRSAPAVDWFSSLGLGESMTAALWHCNGACPGEGIEAGELELLVQAMIESLDTLLAELGAAGLQLTVTRPHHA